MVHSPICFKILYNFSTRSALLTQVTLSTLRIFIKEMLSPLLYINTGTTLSLFWFQIFTHFKALYYHSTYPHQDIIVSFVTLLNYFISSTVVSSVSFVTFLQLYSLILSPVVRICEKVGQVIPLLAWWCYSFAQWIHYLINSFPFLFTLQKI